MSNHRTRQRASSPPSNDPTADFGVSLQVREEACEAALAVRAHTIEARVDAAIPVIAGAAYRAGREEAWKAVEDWAYENYHEDVELDVGGPDTGEPMDDYRTERTEVVALKDLVAALAAIDKEGEN